MSKRPHILFLLFAFLWVILVFLPTNSYYPETFLGSFIGTLNGKVIGEQSTVIEQVTPWLFQIPFLTIFLLSILFMKKYMGKTQRSYKTLLPVAYITTFFTVFHAYSYSKWIAHEDYTINFTDSILIVPILMFLITVCLMKERKKV